MVLGAQVCNSDGNARNSHSIAHTYTEEDEKTNKLKTTNLLIFAALHIRVFSTFVFRMKHMDI